jgi:osmotically-inducible protein OsmY
MKNHQAVSGKSKNGKSWINKTYRKLQKHFIDQSKEIGMSDNLYGRIDLDDQGPLKSVESSDSSLSYSHIIEALKRSPEIDVSQVHVAITGNSVLLQGKASSLKEIRAMIHIVQNLRGVFSVKSELEIEEKKITH